MKFSRGNTLAKTNPRMGRPKGSRNKRTLAIGEFCQSLLEDPAYRAGLRARLQKGKAPHLEPLLYHYAYGKPKDLGEGGDTHYHINVIRYGDIYEVPQRDRGIDHSPRLPAADLPAELPASDAEWDEARPASVAPQKW
jgi:hypothetical protein